MGKDEIFSVKIYYVNPIESISIIIDALINLEYEVYTLSSPEKDKLLKILPKDARVIVFFTIQKKTEIAEWLEFIEITKKLSHQNLQLGAFSYNNISEEDKNKFLENNVPVILLSSVEKKPMETFQNILTLFEAKGKRAYIRVKSLGSAEVYFYFKNREEPLVSKIIDISSFAFSTEIEPIYKIYFEINNYLEDVLLILQGARIRVTVKSIGFSNENPNVYILKFCASKVQDHKVVYVDTTPKDINIKIHGYIRKCLKRDLSKSLEEVD